MDRQTIASYEKNAEKFCLQYHTQAPTELYDTVKGFFHSHGETADIGCGSGRDVCWMSHAGFRATGYDASTKMLEYARAVYPENTFVTDALPNLASLASNHYSNILCSAVFIIFGRTITRCVFKGVSPKRL